MRVLQVQKWCGQLCPGCGQSFVFRPSSDRAARTPGFPNPCYLRPSLGLPFCTLVENSLDFWRTRGPLLVFQKLNCGPVSRPSFRCRFLVSLLGPFFGFSSWRAQFGDFLADLMVGPRILCGCAPGVGFDERLFVALPPFLALVQVSFASRRRRAPVMAAWFPGAPAPLEGPALQLQATRAREKALRQELPALQRRQRRAPKRRRWRAPALAGALCYLLVFFGRLRSPVACGVLGEAA